MSEPDKYDAEVIEMIPCHRLCQDYAGIRFHSGNCCYGVRPAVAARLRADAADLELVREIKNGAMKQLDEARAEIERLKKLVDDDGKEFDRLRGYAIQVERELAQLKRVIQKAAGMAVNRCICVFEADDDSAPVIQCDYHKEQAAEIERLKAVK